MVFLSGKPTLRSTIRVLGGLGFLFLVGRLEVYLLISLRKTAFEEPTGHMS